MKISVATKTLYPFQHTIASLPVFHYYQIDRSFYIPFNHHPLLYSISTSYHPLWFHAPLVFLYTTRLLLSLYTRMGTFIWGLFILMKMLSLILLIPLNLWGQVICFIAISEHVLVMHDQRDYTLLSTISCTRKQK